jgi:hypothetical protein
VGAKLLIFNPSNYPRGGHVATPWSPIQKTSHISADQLKVFDDGVEVPAQVDCIDPGDSRLDTLAFVLRKNLDPGPDDYSRPSGYVLLEDGGKSTTVSSKPIVPAGLPDRIELANGRLVVSLSLRPPKPPEDSGWFSGAAQSFRLYGGAARSVGRDVVEMLDVFQSILDSVEHDPEKRCMQVDRLIIPNPAWSDRSEEEIELFKLSYSVLSYCTGPVRQVCTIVSDPFAYVRPDPYRKRDVPMECQFYRMLILYHDADYLLEELWLKGRDQAKNAHWLDLRFSARYFAQMNMTQEPELRWSEWVPDWFAIGYSQGFVRPGYGFATDAHSRRPQWPHPGYPLPDCAYRAFSWELRPCMRARCLHLFQLNAPAPIEHRIGHTWYEELYKPPRAA